MYVLGTWKITGIFIFKSLLELNILYQYQHYIFIRNVSHLHFEETTLIFGCADSDCIIDLCYDLEQGIISYTKIGGSQPVACHLVASHCNYRLAGAFYHCKSIDTVSPLSLERISIFVLEGYLNRKLGPIRVQLNQIQQIRWVWV